MRPGLRGLTLVEILAATVLLAILASACIPLIAQSATEFENSDALATNAIDQLTLERWADEFLRDTKRYGYRDHAEVLQQGEFTISPEEFSEADASVYVRVLRAVSKDESIEHAWLIFECGHACVARWVLVPPQSPGAGERGGPQ